MSWDETVRLASEMFRKATRNETALWPSQREAYIAGYSEASEQHAKDFLAGFDAASAQHAKEIAVKDEALRNYQRAVEHAEYLAKSAEHFLEALEEVDKLNLLAEESEEDMGDEIQGAEESVRDHWGGVRNAVYEFRKRVPAKLGKEKS